MKKVIMALAIASMSIFAVSCGNNNAKKAAEATEAAAEECVEECKDCADTTCEKCAECCDSLKAAAEQVAE